MSPVENAGAPGGETVGPSRGLVVGRDTELAQLSQLADRSVEDGAQLVFVSGEAGIGKSTLVRTFLDRLASHGWGTHVGQCIEYSERSIPFGPVIRLVRSILREAEDQAGDLLGPHRADLSALLPEWRDEGVDGDSLTGDVDRLIDAISSTVAHAAKDHPQALFIEDIHWADAATRDLVASLVHSLGQARILLLVSERTGAVPRGHVLRTWLAEQRRFPNVHTLDIAGLSIKALMEQAEHILGETPSIDLVREVERRTRGNAFFATELLMARRAGSNELPATLADFLTSRLDQLGEDEQEVLRAMAIAGDAIDHKLLATALPHLDIGPPMRRLFDESIVVIEDGNYTFTHALMREAMLTGVLPFEAEELHRRIAEAIEADPQQRRSIADLAMLATHWAGANDRVRSLVSAVEAAVASASVAAYETAGELAQHAIDLWPAVSDAEQLTGTTADALSVEASDWWGAANKADEAERVLVRTLDRWGQQLPDGRRALLMAKLSTIRYERGQPEDAQNLLAQAIELVADEVSPEAAQVHHRVAVNAIRSASIHEAMAAAERAIEIATETGPEPVLVSALNTRALGVGVTIGVDEGTVLIRETRQRALASNLVSQAAHTYRTEMMITYFHQGRTPQSLDILREGIDFAKERCGPNIRLDLQLDLALGLVEDGSLIEARPLLDELTALRRRDVRTLTVQHVTALYALLTGDLDRASAILADTRKLYDRFSSTERGYQHRLEAELARRSGDFERARREIDDAIGEHLGQDNITFTRESILEQCRLARALAAADPASAADVATAARELVPRAIPEGEAPNALCELMHLELDLVDGSVPAATVRALAQELARSGFGADAKQTELLHAELLAAEKPGSEELAQVLDQLRALGRSSGMTWLVQRADAIMPSTETIDLTEVVDITEKHATPSKVVEDHGLTPREVEVLGMLARGLTNKEIGTELFVSHRTVSTHVSNLLAKLHLKNRSEAAAKYHELGLADLQA